MTGLLFIKLGRVEEGNGKGFELCGLDPELGCFLRSSPGADLGCARPSQGAAAAQGDKWHSFDGFNIQWVSWAGVYDHPIPRDWALAVAAGTAEQPCSFPW